MGQVWRYWGGVLGVWAAVLPLAALAAVALAGFYRSRGLPAARAGWRAAAEVGVFAGTAPWVWLILTPRHGPRLVHLVPFSDLADQVRYLTPPEITVQTVGNLLVFAALGFLAPVRLPALARPGRLLALGAVCSALVEGLQYVLDIGRVTSVDDVLINAVGALLAGLASRPWWTAGAPCPAAADPVGTVTRP
jgi:hypothetical protein